MNRRGISGGGLWISGICEDALKGLLIKGFIRVNGRECGAVAVSEGLLIGTWRNAARRRGGAEVLDDLKWDMEGTARHERLQLVWMTENRKMDGRRSGCAEAHGEFRVWVVSAMVTKGAV